VTAAPICNGPTSAAGSTRKVPASSPWWVARPTSPW